MAVPFTPLWSLGVLPLTFNYFSVFHGFFFPAFVIWACSPHLMSWRACPLFFGTTIPQLVVFFSYRRYPSLFVRFRSFPGRLPVVLRSFRDFFHSFPLGVSTYERVFFLVLICAGLPLTPPELPPVVVAVFVLSPSPLISNREFKPFCPLSVS